MDDYARAELIAVIRQVRKRWRTKLAIRGAVGFLVAGVLAIFALAAALDYFRFSPAAIFGFRFVAGALLLAAAGWFFARPMLRKVSDEQVALYLEEHEPTLDNTILTVMAEPGDRAASPALVGRMIETAVERLHAVEDGARIEREPLRKFSMAVGAVSLVALAPFRLRSGTPAPDPLRAVRAVAQRRGRRALPDRGQAGRCHRPQRRRPGDCRHPLGLRCGRCRRRLQEGRGVQLRARRDVEGRRRLVRGAPLRFERQPGVLRGGGRRALAGVHAQGGRAALRQEARPGVSLPVLHGARTAQGGRRRRHRGTRRHRRCAHRHAHDGHQGRASRDRRQRQRHPGLGRGWHADGLVHGQDRRLLPHRTRRAEWRARDRLAAVHHRHSQRPDADSGRLEAGTRQRRDAGSGVRGRGEGGR